MRRVYLLLLLPLLALALPLRGEDSAATQPSTQPARDPTEASADLAAAINAGADSIGGPGNHAMPTILLRGVVLAPDKPAQALIEVQGSGVSCIHIGSLITQGAMTLTVMDIGNDGIQFQIATTHQIVVVH